MTDGQVVHAYIFAVALVVAIAFGAAWALLPLGIGVALAVLSTLAEVYIENQERKRRATRR